MADYDLAIIGGGLNGASMARDAAGRGLRVVLIEQGDLASAASAACPPLIHGDPALSRMKPPLAPFSAGDRAAAVAGYDQVRGKRVA